MSRVQLLFQRPPDETKGTKGKLKIIGYWVGIQAGHLRIHVHSSDLRLMGTRKMSVCHPNNNTHKG